MKSAGLVASVLAIVAGASAQSVAEKVASLRAAATSVDRINLLQNNEFIFDFLHQSTGETTGAAGHTVAASSANFPALIGNGMAMTIGFLGPCGLNTPHTHPRATEFNFAVNGSIQAGVLVENGARFIFNEIPAGSAAIFPKGAIHFEFNNACEDALFVAAFNDEDPGVDQVAQRFFGLPPDFVAAAMGGIGVQQVAGLESMIPDNVALGTDECLKRCGIIRSAQPTTQRQPRVSANALPPGFNGPPAPAPATPSSSIIPPSVPSPQPSPSVAVPVVPAAPPSPPPPPPVSATQQRPAEDLLSAGATSTNTSKGSSHGLTIALIVIVSVLASGYIILAALWFSNWGTERRARRRGMTYFRTGGDFAPQAALFDAEKRQPFESYYHSAQDLSTPYDPPASRPASSLEHQ